MAEPAVDALVEALRRLPGVGIKSAQRMAFHLLQHDREGARRIATSLQAAVASVRHCERCHTFTEATVCSICANGVITIGHPSSSRTRPISSITVSIRCGTPWSVR